MQRGSAPVCVADATRLPKPLTMRRRVALALMVASGFAALGFQIIWTQQCALWLGHESASVLAVVAAFFGGLAAGALLLGPRIDRSAKPAHWYAACELAIGIWGFALAFFMAPISEWLLQFIGAQPSPVWHWSVAFCGTFLLLLPATAPMGAAMPAMERVLARLSRRGGPIAALYAANTFGAVVGVLAAAFWLVPGYGLKFTAGVCAALNMLCAVAAMNLFTEPGNREPTATPSSARGVLPFLVATGLLGIGFEVLVVRAISQVAENTVYTFAILLAVYLVGTSLGAAAYQRWLSGTGRTEQLRDRLLQVLAAACVLGMLILASATAIKTAALNVFGTSMLAALAAEATVATAAFLLPTILMGALFSHLVIGARDSGIGFGRAIGVNTLGAAFAPLLFGVVLVPEFGLKLSLLLVVGGYLALSSRHAWSTPAQWTALGATLALALVAPSLAIVDVPERGRIVSYKEGILATVSVVEDAGGVARLHIDNRQQEGSSATTVADSRQALLPILLHPAPKRALFLGLGTGVTASAAAEVPLLEVDAVELIPEVIEASSYFTRMANGNAHHRRLHLVTADARRYVRATHERYDVIVSDNFHPARSGSGSLYTVEHFKAVSERLAAEGVFCQWLPLHQLDAETLRSIVRAFVTVYPHGWAMLATNSLDTPVVGLVARSGGADLDVEHLRERLRSQATLLRLSEFGIPDDLALLGSFIAGPLALAQFAGDAPLNTDDHPVVAYSAPTITYVPNSRPRDRLIAFLREVSIRPDELVAAPHDIAWEYRLAAYWAGRNRFIEAGRDVRPTTDARHMLAQVREPLLAVLRISPDFRPAYDPLLRMASALGHSDPDTARTLLGDLRQVQPLRPEAAHAMKELADVAR